MRSAYGEAGEASPRIVARASSVSRTAENNGAEANSKKRAMAGQNLIFLKSIISQIYKIYQVSPKML